jgi:5-methylthioadenosine/S-adenosylhomocysteine deaminase
MTQLTDEEIAQVGELKLNVVHCPESNLKLGSGICPVHRLIEAGANICVGK